METLCAQYRLALSDFSHYNPCKVEIESLARAALVKAMLGWDITNFEPGDLSRCGVVLFTVVMAVFMYRQ